ncbi:hypothetical protein BJ741DRAFT_679057 [Chytriomyces cf. hyalinus JEL632]|nr:hypothetical protein BJ741DRAFT_679057 [Chytriomyces cf. hyalinus JEL632]
MAAETGFLLAKHRRFGSTKALIQAKDTMKFRLKGVENIIAANSTALDGGLTSVIGGILLVTPLTFVGASMLGAGTVVGVVGTLGVVAGHPKRERDLRKAWRAITAESTDNDLLQVIHLLSCIRFGSDDMIDGIVAGFRDGTLQQLCDTVHAIAQGQELGQIVPVYPRLLEHSLVSMFGIASAGMAWAGTYGVAMSQTMSQFLASHGLSWVPGFVSSHAAVLCTVGGAAAILGGIARIIQPIIGIVEAVKEKNKGLETAAE